MKRINQIIIVLVLFGLSGIFIYSTSKKTMVTDKVEAYALPNQIDFAGESTPLNLVDVRERLDREMLINTNLHSTTTLILKRANRVFPVIEPILKKQS